MRSKLALVAVTALLAVGACGNNTDADKPENAGAAAPVEAVKVGVIAILDVAPIYLGKQKGFFSKRSIELTLETGQGGAAIVPGVTSGQFQFGFSNVTSLLLAQSKGVPLKVVCNGVASTGVNGKDFGGVVVKADSPIKSAADLANKTVAVNTLKNIGDTTVRASVRKAGGDGKAVKFVELAFPEMGAALDAKRVDAIWVVEPFLSAAKAAGGRVIASNFVDAAPNLTVATYFTSTQLIASKPDLIKRFTEAMKESLQYADTHPDEVRTVLSTYTQIKADAAAKLILPKWPQDINKASVQTMASLAQGDGLLEKAPDVNTLLPA